MSPTLRWCCCVTVRRTLAAHYRLMFHGAMCPQTGAILERCLQVPEGRGRPEDSLPPLCWAQGCCTGFWATVGESPKQWGHPPVPVPLCYLREIRMGGLQESRQCWLCNPSLPENPFCANRFSPPSLRVCPDSAENPPRAGHCFWDNLSPKEEKGAQYAPFCVGRTAPTPQCSGAAAAEASVQGIAVEPAQEDPNPASGTSSVTLDAVLHLPGPQSPHL